MAQAHKPDFVFRRNRRVHLKRRGRQFSRLLAVEVWASAVVMLDTPRSEVVWRVLATHSIRQFPFHFPSRASPCPITFQLDSTKQLKYATEVGKSCDNQKLILFFKDVCFVSSIGIIQHVDNKHHSTTDSAGRSIKCSVQKQNKELPRYQYHYQAAGRAWISSLSVSQNKTFMQK